MGNDFSDREGCGDGVCRSEDGGEGEGAPLTFSMPMQHEGAPLTFSMPMQHEGAPLTFSMPMQHEGAPLTFSMPMQQPKCAARSPMSAVRHPIRTSTNKKHGQPPNSLGGGAKAHLWQNRRKPVSHGAALSWLLQQLFISQSVSQGALSWLVQ
jgi:hypothetical protein